MNITKLAFQDNREHFLYQDSVLANNCLEQGAKLLIETAPFSRNGGNYYTAFFNLSIGIERFLKVMILQLELFDKNEMTSIPYLKKKGHNLIELYNEMARRMGMKELDENNETYMLLDFLTKFATQDRYFNINALESNGNPQQDIMSRWYDLCRNYYDKSGRSRISFVNIQNNELSIFGESESKRIPNKEIQERSKETETITPYLVEEIQALLFPIFRLAEHRYNKNKEQSTKPFIVYASIFSFFKYQAVTNSNLNNPFLME